MKNELKAYVCVYRHTQPSPRDLERTRKDAKNKPLVTQYLEAYQDSGSFLDWGDDPSFFCSQKLLKNTRKASWGVCRRDVRSALDKGDFVVFICAKQQSDWIEWRYYYIGFGTVGFRIADRERVSRSRKHGVYREFLNILAKSSCGKVIQAEQIHPHHDDWRKRIEGPYLIFDGDPHLTDFNLRAPLWIASYRPGGDYETWRRGKLVRELETTLFVDRGIARRLRTSSAGYPHPKLNLGKRPGASLSALRNDLKRISVAARKGK